MRIRPATLLGLLSLLLLDVALNVLLLRQEALDPWVLVPGGLGLAAGAVWVVLYVARLARAAHVLQGASGFNAVAASVVFFLICVVLYAFALRWDISWDLTREGRRDLAPQTVRVLESIDREVEVFGLFITAGDSAATETAEKTRRFLERCQRHTPYLKVSFSDPEQDSLIMTQLDIKRVGLEGTVLVRSGGARKEVPVSAVVGKLDERDFTNALINVIRSSRPKVYFLTGHGEADIHDQDPKTGASRLGQWLQDESYEVDRLAINIANPAIPSDCNILFINGQNRDFHQAEVQAIQDFLDRGGRLLVLFDLWRVLDQDGVMAAEQFRPWLARRYGILVGDDIILSREAKAEVLMVPDYGIVDLDSEYRGSYNDNHPVTMGFDQNMIFSGVRSVRLADPMPEGTAGEVLLRSLPNCWAETNLRLLFESENHVPRPDPDELQGAVPLAVAVTARTDTPVGDTGQTRDARIVAIGSREFGSNAKIIVMGHLNLIMNALAWLNESEELIGMRAEAVRNPSIVLSTADEQRIAWIASLGILHVVFAAAIAVFLIRRRAQ
jgi:hypothetical protein